MKILGIDPGKQGGYCLLEQGKKPVYGKYPLLPNDEIDATGLFETLSKLKPTHIFLEQVHSIFGTSAKSNFSFGKSVGITETVLFLMKKPLTMVKPKEWQKQVWTGKMVKNPKINSLTTAMNLFPEESFLATNRSKVPHDGIIDATLIAYYGMLRLNRK